MDGLLDAADTVAGGAGTDILAVDAVTSAASAAAVSGFETLRIDTVGQDHPLANFAGSNTFTSVQVNNNATSTASTAGTALASLSFGAAANTATDFVMTRLVDGAADSFSINAPATGNVQYDNITLVDEETITINSGAGNFVMDVLAVTDLTSLTLAGVGGIDVGTGAAMTGATKLATVDASGVTGAVDVNASSSLIDMTVTGPAAGIMDITTGNGADTVTTGTGNDIILTGVGADTITSGSGNDTITAGGHADTITSGAGNDTIIGGAGNDNITTGAGTDDVQLSASGGVDTITDFTPGTDDIKVATTTGGDAALIAALDASVRTTTVGNADIVLADNDIEYISINGAVGNLDDAGSLSLTESDLTATDLTNLAEYIDERFNASGTLGHDALFVVNWTASGTNAYIYHMVDTVADANLLGADFTHVATVNHGLTTTPLVAGDLIA
jgi:Ca2+-binding RTX toxin-like protein